MNTTQTVSKQENVYGYIYTLALYP